MCTALPPRARSLRVYVQKTRLGPRRSAYISGPHTILDRAVHTRPRLYSSAGAITYLRTILYFVLAWRHTLPLEQREELALQQRHQQAMRENAVTIEKSADKTYRGEYNRYVEFVRREGIATEEPFISADAVKRR